MASIKIDDLVCLNEFCEVFRKEGLGNICRHGFYRTKRGKVRRLSCERCESTFSLTKGTAYYRLKKSHRLFDEVAEMSVEGIDRSTISRLKQISISTTYRWLRRASLAATDFNEKHLCDYEIKELQADEIKTFSGGKDDTKWIFADIEVWSRLWPSFVVGRRSYRNTYSLLNLTHIRAKSVVSPFLITTDGFEFYGRAVRQLFGSLAIHGQVMKRYRNNRVSQISRSLIQGTAAQLENALYNSEDSSTINTSFIERLNLTIRQGSSYLHRRTPAHSRDNRCLVEHLILQQCHYNFIRPHESLKLGKLEKTPAMQAGIMESQVTFRQVFESGRLFLVQIVIDDKARAWLWTAKSLIPGEGTHNYRISQSCLGEEGKYCLAA